MAVFKTITTEKDGARSQGLFPFEKKQYTNDEQRREKKQTLL